MALKFTIKSTARDHASPSVLDTVIEFETPARREARKRFQELEEEYEDDYNRGDNSHDVLDLELIVTREENGKVTELPNHRFVDSRTFDVLDYEEEEEFEDECPDCGDENCYGDCDAEEDEDEEESI